MKLKEIHRTATFAWSPSQSIPFLASGTVSGALDESFSNESQLEVWALDFLDRNEYDLGGEGQVGPKGTVTTNSRYLLRVILRIRAGPLSDYGYYIPATC